MSTEIRLDLDNDPKASFKVDTPKAFTTGQSVVRICIHHDAGSTFLWLTPEQARVIRGGIGVALDTLTFAVPPNVVLGGE